MLKNSIVTFILSLLVVSLFAQVRGNKKIKTQTWDYTNITAINVNFPINATIEANESKPLTLVADENLFKYIGVKVKNGTLYITQDAWIQPSKDVVLKIGVANLKQLKTSGYGNYKVQNLDQEILVIDAGVGTVTLEGKVKEVKLSVTTGKIHASALKTQKAIVHITSHGTIKINPTELLEAKTEGRGQIVYDNEPKTIKKNTIKENTIISSKEEAKRPKKAEVKYIKLKVKNNSKQFINTYVRGPRNRRFSYGLPFKRNQVRTENFPIGTEIFLVSKIGMRKLLMTITEADEGKVVDLF